MTPLAWAHLPGSLYPERQAARESRFDEWARAHFGRLLPALLGADASFVKAARAAGGLEPQVTALDDLGLRCRLREAARDAWAGGSRLGEALACVREAARRSLGMRPYDTQLRGAAALIGGRMVEMQTGEGKTLTAALAAAIVASAGVPVHVITVNDYLAQRDAEEMGVLLAFFGLRCGAIVTGIDLCERRRVYSYDVAYCTGKELVFDYLKDRAASGPSVNQASLRLNSLLGGGHAAPLLRGLHFGIVDEADSVLIDEARTPLILSESAGPVIDRELIGQALAIAQAMRPQAHYELHHGRRELHLLPAGRLWLTERCVVLGREWAVRQAREHWAVQALRAIHLFRRDEHYIVKEGKVLIVDENTGRSMPGRTWEQGLHQMVEVKEGCELSDEARTVARITYQRFFARYLRLAGMTGTAHEVQAELWREYRLKLVIVPPHRTCVRRLWPTRCVASEAEKWESIADCAIDLASRGRPLLIGTRSVAASERLSQVLQRRNLPHRVLNALQDSHEAELVKSAGLAATVTVATNMAGRGTDIKLPDAVREAGGLHVILSEYHESRRVDRQLVGRAARQGDPGSAQAIVSFDDPLFARHAPWWARRLAAWARPAAAGARLATRLLRTRAQAGAERLQARVRRQAVQHDRRLESSLGFSGRQ